MFYVSNINEKNELFKGFGHYYYAPEIESENAITQKVDICSIGKIMHFLLIRNKKENDSIQENSQLNEIYDKCIEKCPEKRLNISSLIKLLYECFFCKITKVSETKSIKLVNNIHSRTSFSFLLFLSDYKNEYAQYYLSKFYEKGKYLIKNISKAIHYYLLSAQQSNGKAKRKLISLFNKIDLSLLNDDDRHQYIVLTAKKTFLEGIIYLKGKYDEQNIVKSTYYLSEAANQSHVEAQYKLGKIYNEEKYVARDIFQAQCKLNEMKNEQINKIYFHYISLRKPNTLGNPLTRAIKEQNVFKRNVEGLINEYNEMLKREKENYKMQKNVLEEESKEKNNLKRKENQENPNDIELILNENI